MLKIEVRRCYRCNEGHNRKGMTQIAQPKPLSGKNDILYWFVHLFDFTAPGASSYLDGHLLRISVAKKWSS